MMRLLPLCLLAVSASAAESKPASAFVLPPRLDIRTLPTEWSVITVSPSGAVFATGDKSGLSAWRFGDKKPFAHVTWPLDAEWGGIVPIAISNDDRLALTARLRNNDTFELAVLDLVEEKVLKVLESRPQRCSPADWDGLRTCDRVGPGSFSLDGLRASYMSGYDSAGHTLIKEEKTWDLEGNLLSTTMRRHKYVKNDPIGWLDEKGGSQTECRETAAGSLAVRRDPGSCSIIDCVGGKRLAFLDDCKGGDYRDFRVTPDGRRILAVGDGDRSAVVWDAAGGKLLRAWQMEDDGPWRVGLISLRLSDDGRFAVEKREHSAGGRPKAVRLDLVEVETGKRIGRLESAVDAEQHMTAVASDGSVAFLHGGGHVHLWRFGPGRKLAPLPARAAAPLPVASVPARPAAPAAPLRPNFTAEARPDDLAVIVGVESYSGIATKAPYAEKDAEAFKDYVRALGVPERNIVLLTGSKAVRSALTKNIEGWLARMAKPASRVYFYFSGHGAPDVKTGQAYLVPWDGDPDFLDATAYPLAQLYRKLADLPAEQVLVALDSCFSGAGGRSVLASGARPLVAKIETGSVPAKLTVLAAAAANEISGSLDDRRHGAFTYFLLEGLNAGKSTPRELRDYLVPLVQDEARRLNRDQTPQLQGDGGWSLR